VICVRVTDIFVTGLGAYLPERVSLGEAAGRGLGPAGQAEADGLTGVLVAGETPAPEMALRAAQDAFKRSGQPPEELDALFYTHLWHQGFNEWLPWSYVQHHLTGPDMFALDLKQGSNGMFAALQLAVGYLRGDSGRRRALLVCADNFGTPLVDRWHPGRFLLGDAAAAVTVGKEPGFARLLSVCSTDLTEAEEALRGGQPLFPPGTAAGRQASFAALPPDPADAVLSALAERTMTDTFQAALSEAGIGVADVTRMAVANSTRETVERRQFEVLGVDPARSAWDFGRSVGHCGTADQVLALNQLICAGELRPGDHFVMFGLGIGTGIACAVLEIVAVPAWAS
jgi:3-oxoacyl-[acyl-carrier-protein] synthase-3/clorobiocin biosynthesis protein CloN2